MMVVDRRHSGLGDSVVLEATGRCCGSAAGREVRGRRDQRARAGRVDNRAVPRPRALGCGYLVTRRRDRYPGVGGADRGRGGGRRGAETGGSGTAGIGRLVEHVTPQRVVSFVTSGRLAGWRVRVPLRSSGSLDQAELSRLSRREAPSRECNAGPGLPGVCTPASGAA